MSGLATSGLSATLITRTMRLCASTTSRTLNHSKDSRCTRPMGCATAPGTGPRVAACADGTSTVATSVAASSPAASSAARRRAVARKLPRRMTPCSPVATACGTPAAQIGPNGGGRSDLVHGVGLRALLTLRDLELHAVALFEALVPGRVDRAVVHEHVRPTVLGDEPVALLRVEPLHRA